MQMTKEDQQSGAVAEQEPLKTINDEEQWRTITTRDKVNLRRRKQLRCIDVHGCQGFMLTKRFKEEGVEESTKDFIRT